MHPPHLFDLTGQVAVITGGTRGIGQAAALGLTKYGADIILLQRDISDQKTKKRIEALGGKAKIIACDMGNQTHLKTVIPKIIEEYQRLDILVNSAGIQRRAPAIHFSEDDWDEVININLKALWLLSQAAGQYMVQQKRGKIINIASLLSFQGGITVPAYAAAKGGVSQLTKALANEWAQHNVNVNAIAPGYIATEMNTALLEDETRNRQILERIPAGRWGTPEDFAGTVVYLASKASTYVHGHTLVVDGGWLGR